MTPDAYVLPIDAPCDWLRSNDRRHFHAAAALTRKWRETTAWRAKQARLPKLTGPVEITAVIHRADKRRADAPNSWPSVKAAIDGLVDAGVIPDDNDSVVRATTFIPGEPLERSRLTLIIRPAKETAA